MLYITTRNNKDAFTAPRTLQQDLAPDGGLYVPFHLPAFSESEKEEFRKKSFGETVSHILNLFFSSRLNGWDVDFCIGRNPFKFSQLNHKTVVAELWHNPDGEMDYVVQSLYHRVYPESFDKATEWFCLAVRIAVLFALYGELLRQNLMTDADLLDAVVPGDDLSACAAVNFAKSMGLPVKTVICGCSEGTAVLELLRRGTFNTKCPEGTEGTERLIHSCLNSAEALRFAEACSNGESYSIGEDAVAALNRSVFTAAVSRDRIRSVVHSTQQTNHYPVNEKTALALAGLQDYRTNTGENRIALVLMDKKPTA